MSLLPALLVLTSLCTQPTYSFAVLGDTQSNQRIFKRAVKDIKKRKLNFAVHVGDLYWRSSTRWWKWYKKKLNYTKIPWHMVMGNHEILLCAYGCSRKWKNFWRKKKYRRSTLKIFDKYGDRFILMDSADHSTPMSHINRIRKALRSAKNKSVFLFTHKPLPYNGGFKVRYGPNKRSWHWYWVMSGTGWYGNNKILWRLLDKYNHKIKSLFHGHYHAFRRYKIGKIQAYCTGGGGGKLETRHDYYHYLIVTINKHGYSIKVVRL